MPERFPTSWKTTTEIMDPALLTRLDRIDWSDLPRAHREAQDVLAAIEDPRTLLQAVGARDPQLTESDRSSEKTTHFKWFVAEDPAGRFSLWLNEYKPGSHRRLGHAEVAHNHRFWFTSLVLGGGFTNIVYAPAEDASLECVRTTALRAGDSFVVDPDEVHSLRDLQDGTLTLIVQSRPVRSYSDVYENGSVLRYRDLPSARRSFNDRLGALKPFAAHGRRHH